MQGFNGTNGTAWSELVGNLSLVNKHPAFGGYYGCDDCCHMGSNMNEHEYRGIEAIRQARVPASAPASARKCPASEWRSDSFITCPRMPASVHTPVKRRQRAMVVCCVWLTGCHGSGHDCVLGHDRTF